MSYGNNNRSNGGYSGGNGMVKWEDADKQLVQGDNLTKSDILERVVILGDLSVISSEQRMVYYNQTCESMGLNPLTRPFQYLYLQNKLQLYPARACADQLRKINGVSSKILFEGRDPDDKDLYKVIVEASSNGRCVQDVAYLTITNMSGLDLANAKMKTVTKANRRATLAFCGLGLPHVDDIEEKDPVQVDEEAKRSDESRSRLLGRTVQAGESGQLAEAQAKPGAAELRETLKRIYHLQIELWPENPDGMGKKFQSDNPQIKSAPAMEKALAELAAERRKPAEKQAHHDNSDAIDADFVSDQDDPFADAQAGAEKELALA